MSDAPAKPIFKRISIKALCDATGNAPRQGAFEDSKCEISSAQWGSKHVATRMNGGNTTQIIPKRPSNFAASLHSKVLTPCGTGPFVNTVPRGAPSQELRYRDGAVTL